MFNLSKELLEISTTMLEANSIWNSAGLSDEKPAVMPPVDNPRLPSSHGSSSDLIQFPSPPDLIQFQTPATSEVSSKVSSPVSPLQGAVRDPGYYSESECSSNSSDKDNIQNVIAKVLVDQARGSTPLTKPQEAPAPFDPTVGTFARKFDSQSFDAQDFAVLPESLGDESWKVIKKPGVGGPGEASIVPDYGGSGWKGAKWINPGSPKQAWNSAPSPKPHHFNSKQQVCVFCRNNGEDPSVYSTHTLMSTAGKVICPILYAYKCPICHASGDYAHTLKYCPRWPKGISYSSAKFRSGVPTLGPVPPPSAATFPQHLSSKTASVVPPSVSMLTATFPQHLTANNQGFSQKANIHSDFSQKVNNLPATFPKNLTKPPPQGPFNSLADIQEALSLYGNTSQGQQNLLKLPPQVPYNSLADIQEAISSYGNSNQGQQNLPKLPSQVPFNSLADIQEAISSYGNSNQGQRNLPKSPPQVPFKSLADIQEALSSYGNTMPGQQNLPKSPPQVPINSLADLQEAIALQSNTPQGPPKPLPDINTPLGTFNSLEDLQEAAQKILQFTKQLQAIQQQGRSSMPPATPQVAQFLLKVDPGSKQDSANNSSLRNSRFANNSSFAGLGKGNVGFSAEEAKFFQDRMGSIEKVNQLPENTQEFSSPFDKAISSLPRPASFEMPPSSGFNVSAPAFTPSFGAIGARRDLDEKASAEIVKMLGINKMEGSALNFNKMEGSALNFNKLEGSALNFNKMEGSALNFNKMEGSVLNFNKMEGSAMNFRADEKMSQASTLEKENALACILANININSYRNTG